MGDRPYEDTFISTYSLALGYALGARPDDDTQAAAQGAASPSPIRLPASVSSLQRTRKDTELGDVLTFVKDWGVLIEFKRDLAGWRDEVAKAHKKAVLDGVAELPTAGELRSAHWFAYGAHTWDVENPDFRFAPYLSLKDALNQQGPDAIKAGSVSLEAFLRSLRGRGSPESTPAVGLALEPFLAYLGLVQALSSASAGGASTGDDVAGMLVAFDADGRLLLVAFRSLTQLRDRLIRVGWDPRVYHEKWLRHSTRRRMAEVLERAGSQERQPPHEMPPKAGPGAPGQKPPTWKPG